MIFHCFEWCTREIKAAHDHKNVCFPGCMTISEQINQLTFSKNGTIFFI